MLRNLIAHAKCAIVFWVRQFHFRRLETFQNMVEYFQHVECMHVYCVGYRITYVRRKWCNFGGGGEEEEDTTQTKL